MVTGKKGKNGSKKYGRYKEKCAKYLRENRRIKNKILKIARHLRKHVNDLESIKRFTELQ